MSWKLFDLGGQGLRVYKNAKHGSVSAKHRSDYAHHNATGAVDAIISDD